MGNENILRVLTNYGLHSRLSHEMQEAQGLDVGCRDMPAKVEHRLALEVCRNVIVKVRFDALAQWNVGAAAPEFA